MEENLALEINEDELFELDEDSVLFGVEIKSLSSSPQAARSVKDRSAGIRNGRNFMGRKMHFFCLPWGVFRCFGGENEDFSPVSPPL